MKTLTVEETYKELIHGLNELPDFVNVRARLDDGLMKNWYIDGVGK